MTDTVLASLGSIEPVNAEAWAVGHVFSPFTGSAGVSASAWMISYDQWQTPVVPTAIPSREANRDQWYAGIKAISGVVEQIPQDSVVNIYVVEEKFEILFRRRWLKANGKPAAGFDVAEQIYLDVETKNLTVYVLYRPADGNAAVAQQAARSKAGERYRSLPDERLLVAPPFRNTKAKNRTQRGFPVVRDDKSKS